MSALCTDDGWGHFLMNAVDVVWAWRESWVLLLWFGDWCIPLYLIFCSIATTPSFFLLGIFEFSLLQICFNLAPFADSRFCAGGLIGPLVSNSTAFWGESWWVQWSLFLTESNCSQGPLPMIVPIGHLSLETGLWTSYCGGNPGIYRGGRCCCISIANLCSVGSYQWTTVSTGA